MIDHTVFTYQTRFLKYTRTFFLKKNIQEILSSPISLGYEGGEEQMTTSVSDYILPYSSSPSKIMAVSLLKTAVYSIAPCYRIDEKDDIHSPFFYQISVELPEKTLFDAMNLLSEFVAEMCYSFGKTVPQITLFQPMHDLSDYLEYEKGVKEREKNKQIAAFHLYPRHSGIQPYVKRTLKNDIQCGFDLILPTVGEIATGGEKNLNYLNSMGYDLDFPILPSAGFGVGLERLLLFLTDKQDIAEFIY
jgi:aspartyl/asparaginyl-tRNA synthetase